MSIIKFFIYFISYFTPNPRIKNHIRRIGSLNSDSIILRYIFNQIYPKIKVQKYREKKSKANTVIYSCITNGYDTPKKIFNPKPEYDYILFCDNPDIYEKDKYVWEFRKFDTLDINTDPSRLSRYPKFKPHILLPEYEESIYIDANIDIISNKLYEDLEIARKNNSIISIGTHPKRQCIYQEIERCIRGSVDDTELLKKHELKLKSEGYPYNYGLFENNIIYRKHNNISVAELGDTCWDMLLKGSKRDQLSLVYAAWKLNLPIQKLDQAPYRKLKKDLIIFPHIKNGKKIK